ncbi:hypothetical protein HDV01_004700 [Terramyces sp. JEL0728]|nr:hypothetical protein HDV01_004700 [Terramyces sp. JEL0728]
MDLESLPSLKHLNKAERHAVYEQYSAKGQYFAVEYCPKSTKAAKCRACNTNLKEGELRFRHIVCNNKCFQKKKTDVCGRFHTGCFFKHQKSHLDHFQHSHCDWILVTSSSQFAGFTRIKESDKELLDNLVKQFAPGNQTETDSKLKEPKSPVNEKTEASPNKSPAKIKAEDSLNENVKRVKK